MAFLPLTILAGSFILIEELPLMSLISTQNQGQLLINGTLELNGTTVRCNPITGITAGGAMQTSLIVNGNTTNNKLKYY